MGKSFHLVAASVLAIAASAPAIAQNGDQVIMRRVMGPSITGLPGGATPTPTTGTPTPTPNPTPAPTPTPAPLPQADWVVGEWHSDGPAACTTSAPQSRAVSCQAAGAIVDASRCTGAMPETSRMAARYDGCSYEWRPGEWSTYSSSCSAAATRTRTIACVRSDGTTSAESQCDPVTRPTSTEQSAVYESCSHAWSTGEFLDPGASCTPTETQTRPVVCRRELDQQIVDDGACATASRPAATRLVEDYSDCSYSATAWSEWTWQSTCSATATKTRRAQCLRSDGTVVADSECAAHGVELVQTAQEANYSSCSHHWVAGQFVDPGESCTASETQTRSISCIRDVDGATVEDGLCASADRPGSTQKVADYSGCQPYWYTAYGWSDWSSTCSSSATRTRELGCFRRESECDPASDMWVNIGGDAHECFRRIDPAECRAYPTATREGYAPGRDDIETAAVYSGCGYVATATEWGTCGYYNPATPREISRNRQVTCTRSDGTVVAASQCGREAVEYQACNGDGTPYEAEGIRGTEVPSTLREGQVAIAPNGSTTMVYQGDGNLCIYGNRSFGNGIWCTMAYGYAPGRMEFVDGQIREIDADGKVFWATGAPNNPGSRLVLQDSGKLLVLSPGGSILWSN